MSAHFAAVKRHQAKVRNRKRIKGKRVHLVGLTNIMRRKKSTVKMAKVHRASTAPRAPRI